MKEIQNRFREDFSAIYSLSYHFRLDTQI